MIQTSLVETFSRNFTAGLRMMYKTFQRELNIHIANKNSYLLLDIISFDLFKGVWDIHTGNEILIFPCGHSWIFVQLCFFFKL